MDPLDERRRVAARSALAPDVHLAESDAQLSTARVVRVGAGLHVPTKVLIIRLLPQIVHLEQGRRQ